MSTNNTHGRIVILATQPIGKETCLSTGVISAHARRILERFPRNSKYHGQTGDDTGDEEEKTLEFSSVAPFVNFFKGKVRDVDSGSRKQVEKIINRREHSAAFGRSQIA